jgi:acetoin utilization deacetylase AcuC-like enzyme
LDANLNLPVPPGTADDQWLAKVGALVEFADGVDFVVVSLGVDSFVEDPESPLRVTVDGHEQAGELIAGLGRPTVVVQEGGYVVDRLGELVVSFLRGLESG